MRVLEGFKLQYYELDIYLIDCVFIYLVYYLTLDMHVKIHHVKIQPPDMQIVESEARCFQKTASLALHFGDFAEGIYNACSSCFTFMS